MTNPERIVITGAAFGWDRDVLVNNAAVGESGPIAEMPLQLVRELFEVRAVQR